MKGEIETKKCMLLKRKRCNLVRCVGFVKVGGSC